MKTKYVNHKIEQPSWPSNCNAIESIFLGSINTNKYLNIYLETSRDEDHCSANVCIEPSTARRLRDALNEIYPPEAGLDQDSWDKGFDVGFEAGQSTAEVDFHLNQQEKWQEVTVDHKGAGHTYRLKVPGGYLYRTVTYRYPELHAAMEDGEFFYDPNHRTTRHQRAMEIVAQNTTFVPLEE